MWKLRFFVFEKKKNGATGGATSGLSLEAFDDANNPVI